MEVSQTMSKHNARVYIRLSRNERYSYSGSIDNQIKLADIYWQTKNNKKGKKFVYETIVDGKIKVIEIIKENDKIKQIYRS